MRPIAPGLWTDEAEPRLIGGRRADGEIVFPLPAGDAADGYEALALSRTGTLWSWTRQDFEPKAPYDGPRPFAPYLLGYVELDEVIVEARLTGARLEELRLGQPMRLTIVPFDGERLTYAFEPEPAS